MALTLSIREGEDVYLNDTRAVVNKVLGESSFEISIDEGTFLVSDEKMTQVTPDVMMSAGVCDTLGTAKVVLKAPKEVVILRGAVYRGEA